MGDGPLANLTLGKSLLHQFHPLVRRPVWRISGSLSGSVATW
jgi:hypothetical protein